MPGRHPAQLGEFESDRLYLGHVGEDTSCGFWLDTGVSSLATRALPSSTDRTKTIRVCPEFAGECSVVADP